MALVFPVVHDHEPVSDAAPSNSWEIVSRTYFEGVGTEINPLPGFDGPETVSSGAFPYGPYEGGTSSFEGGQLPISFNGELIWARFIKLSQSGQVNNYVPMIYRLGSDGWTNITYHTTFLEPYKNDGTTFQSATTPGLFVFKGDLYANVIYNDQAPPRRVNLWDSAHSHVFRYLGGTSWEAVTPEGGLPWRSVSYGNIDYHLQDPSILFSINDKLHVLNADRREGSFSVVETTFVIHRQESDGSWTRFGSTSGVNRPIISPSAFACNGECAFFAYNFMFPRFVPASSSYIDAVSSSYYYPPGSNDYARSETVSHCADGNKIYKANNFVTGTGYNNYTDAQAYYYVSELVEGQTFLSGASSGQIRDPDRRAVPSTPRPSVMADWKMFNGKEYILMATRSSAPVGIWLYRKDGSAWTMLGGGNARNADHPSGFMVPDAHLFFVRGTPHVAFREYVPGDKASLVIARTAA